MTYSHETWVQKKEISIEIIEMNNIENYCGGSKEETRMKEKDKLEAYELYKNPVREFL